MYRELWDSWHEPKGRCERWEPMASRGVTTNPREVATDLLADVTVEEGPKRRAGSDEHA